MGDKGDKEDKGDKGEVFVTHLGLLYKFTKQSNTSLCSLACLDSFYAWLYFVDNSSVYQGN